MFFLFLGILLSLYFYTSSGSDENKVIYRIDSQDLNSFNTGLIALDIFLNNIIVGLLLSIFGFFSGGLLSILILFWNGYLIGSIYIESWANLSLNQIFYYSKHIPLELFAFVLFANFGLKGFVFYKKLFKYKIDIGLIPSYRCLILPTILLLIASIIEIL
jgi:uncharacterized membrane protein SpoIIM required for sporulation